ncbi:Imm1 family immunity protein [Lentzea sp. E54]|uniref:Imm1 family immunity protein n=1 Tax=Lentzea xerophila TaxID=3435883 RepID=UPI003DA3EF8C
MELKVWWDEDSDEPTFVRTLEELDALRVQASAVDYPVLFEMLDASDPYRVILNAGFFGDRGVLYYSGGEHRHGLYSKNPDDGFSAPENRLYYYMSSDREFPMTAEYPVDIVWQACKEYMMSDGERPTVVEWQPSSVLNPASDAAL